VTALGRRTWALAGGRVPLRSDGPEPQLTSRDQLAILNTGARPAKVSITLYYADRDPVGPYRVEVAARRVRKVRFNDLIDPLPVPLDAPFGAVLRADRPVVVQLTRLDSAADGGAWIAASAFPAG
jgi:hypothetical protein